MRRAIACVLVSMALTATHAGADTTIPWDEAEKHVGEAVAVEGRVLGVQCGAAACTLAFDPAFKRFTVTIEARTFAAFPPDELDQRYAGRRVRVRGTIQRTEGKPGIVVSDPDALVLADDAQRRQVESDQAQVELMERLGTVLERVEEMTERLAATQERVEALLLELEQRAAALTPPSPSVVALPNDGAPLPRPGFEALRTVKRGMTAAEVERLIGEPQYVERTGTGWATWYYDLGRSITFDDRGRARSLVGFPAP